MIRFQYQPTFKDYLALNRHVLGRHLGKLIVIAVCLLALYLALPFLSVITDATKGVWGIYWSGTPLLILPALVVFLVIATYVGARKRWKAAEEIRIEREYQIDDIGVRVTGSSLSGFLEWRHFTDAEILKEYFVLKTAQNQYHFFPASVVPDRKALAELLRNKISNSGQKKAARRARIKWLVWLIVIGSIVAILQWFKPSQP